MSTTRRKLLQSALASVALTAIPPIARADTKRVSRAKRILVLHLSGGIRSSAAFHASRKKALNPWGVVEKTGDLALGKLLDDHLAGSAPLHDADYTLGAAWDGLRLPRLRESAKRFAVVGTWEPERGDHVSSEHQGSTGALSGNAPGLLVRVRMGLGSADDAVPPFEVSPMSSLGHAPNGSLSPYTPVVIYDPDRLPSSSDDGDDDAAAATGNDYAENDVARDALDDINAAAHVGLNRELVLRHESHRRAGRIVGRELAEPWLHLSADADATHGTVTLNGRDAPLTNGMLLELFNRPLSGDGASPPDGELAAIARELALAVRLLELGSPAVALGIGGWDLHSGERKDAPPLYSFFGRSWASLGFLLARIPEPSGAPGSMLDHTLVVTTSDFGRDPGLDRTGFNGGDGSDHGSHPACFYLAHALMGAGVRGGRITGAVSTDTFDGAKADVRYAPPQLLATILDALGLDPANPEWGLPGFAPIPGLCVG